MPKTFQSINLDIDGVPVEFIGVEYWPYVAETQTDPAIQSDVLWQETRIGGMVIDPLLTGAQSDFFADRLIRYLED